MSPFWIGVTIALIAEWSDWLYALFTFESFWSRVRVFLYWLPPNISLAFAAGFLAEILHSTQNETAVGLLAVACFAMTLSIAYILEKSGFVLRKVWMDWSEEKLRATGKLLYSAALVVSLVPYAVFFRTAIMWRYALIAFAIVLLIEWLLYNRVWNFLHSFESATVRERLETLIQALCHRCVAECPFYLDDDVDVLALLTHTRDELVGSLRATSDLLFQIMRFTPLDRHDRPLPGLTDGVLPPRRVKAIAKEVQTTLLEQLELRGRIVNVLVGTDAEALESTELLTGKIDPATLGRLQTRRLELNRA
jgi:hypothetical protein